IHRDGKQAQSEFGLTGIHGSAPFALKDTPNTEGLFGASNEGRLLLIVIFFGPDIIHRVDRRGRADAAIHETALVAATGILALGDGDQDAVEFAGMAIGVPKRGVVEV